MDKRKIDQPLPLITQKFVGGEPSLKPLIVPPRPLIPQIKQKAEEPEVKQDQV